MGFLSKLFHKSNNYLELQKENVELKAENAELKTLVSEQAVRISELEKKNELLLIKKDSHNSSMPPANDIVKKNKSLRPKTNRKPGGQKGHKGHNLEFSENPDEVIKLSPQYCNKCGLELDNSPGFDT